MAYEVVKQILEVEREADEMIKKSQSRALDLQNSAKHEADLILQNATQEAKKYYKDVILKYENKAREDIALLEEDGKGVREKFINIPQDLLNTAVNMVIERIVSSHGDS